MRGREIKQDEHRESTTLIKEFNGIQTKAINLDEN